MALVGGSVSNQGFIAASKGTAALAAGDRLMLNFNGNSLMSVTIDQGALDALVENRQAIHADGGTVLLTAKAADALIDPDGFTIANSGGDLNAAMLSTLLYNNSIEIQSVIGSGSGSGSDGALNVSDAVTWASNTTLTLTATNDVNVNAAITATGARAGLLAAASTSTRLACCRGTARRWRCAMAATTTSAPRPPTAAPSSPRRTTR